MAIRIGIISFAHIHAHGYAAGLQSMAPEVELAGIYDDDAARGKTVAENLGVPFFDQCGALLDECDGVVVTSENSKHKDFVLAAAEKQKYVLCEKPIAPTLADGRAMIEAFKGKNNQLMIAFPCRYSVPIRRAVEIVQQGKLGRIFALKGTNRGTMPGDWFCQPELSGGGAVIDHTVHVIDVWRWMLGKEPVSVYAEADRLFYTDYEVEDAGLLSIEFENGVFASLDTSWSRPNQSFPTWGDVTMEIVGEQGSLSLDAFNQKFEVYDNQAVKAEWACWTDNIDQGLVNGFIKMIQNREMTPISGHDGLKATEVALGAYRSMEAGGPVQLPLQD